MLRAGRGGSKQTSTSLLGIFYGDDVAPTDNGLLAAGRSQYRRSGDGRGRRRRRVSRCALYDSRKPHPHYRVRIARYYTPARDLPSFYFASARYNFLFICEGPNAVNYMNNVAVGFVAAHISDVVLRYSHGRVIINFALLLSVRSPVRCQI